MRKVALAPILSLLIASALPAFAAPDAALSPGKPAGVKRAQDQDSTVPLAVFGAAAVGIGIALAVSDDGDAATPTPPATTTTTTTAP
jgi:hypothetical protein